MCVVDESGANERTGYRKYGYLPINTPMKEKGGAKRSKRWSLLPAMTLDGYLPNPLIYQGTVNVEMFEDWLELHVIPHLERRSFLVIDNASIHISKRITSMCEQAGIQLEYLPPYSPDFNPIELSFNKLKTWIKRNIRDAKAFSTFSNFLAFGVNSMDTAAYAPAWFWHAGY